MHRSSDKVVFRNRAQVKKRLRCKDSGNPGSVKKEAGKMYLRKAFDELMKKESPVKFFSFSYAGKKCDLSQIPCSVETDAQEKLKMIYEVIPGVVKVTFEVIRRHDFPVIEYTPYIENISDRASAVVSEFSVLDFEADVPGSGSLKFRYQRGSRAQGMDFWPRSCELSADSGINSLKLESKESRCSADFLPFFGIDHDDMNGINLAIGWSGAWQCSVERKEFDGGRTKFHIHCGMKKAAFKLLPGEKFMQPGILLHFRENKNCRDGQNEFRRMMIAHHAPRNSRGELIKPPVSLCFWGGLETHKQIERIKVAREKKLPYEEVWIDAGWMGSPGPCPHFWEKSDIKSDWPRRVGSWDFNTWAHPQGLRPIADAAHEAGMRLLVWFEMLRVHSASGGAVLTEHPEWLLGEHAYAAAGNDVNFLLNIGIPEARQYLFETICSIIEREGIDDFREDFNLDPQMYWNMGDEPGRTGVTEMKFVEGVYLFWEALRKRFPDMFIDNCASGGRRLDYKMASFSFPLCQSDFATYRVYEVEYIQLENIFLDEWLPLHGTLNWGEDDPYHAVSGLGGGYGSKIWQFNGREVAPDHDFEHHRKILQWGKKLRDIHLTGDVYPLVDKTVSDWSLWHGQQIHDPRSGNGMVQLYRCPNAAEPDFFLDLAALEPDAVYETEFFSGEKRHLSGRELALLVIHLESPRSFEILSYRKLLKNKKSMSHT